MNAFGKLSIYYNPLNLYYFVKINHVSSDMDNLSVIYRILTTFTIACTFRNTASI